MEKIIIFLSIFYKLIGLTRFNVGEMKKVGLIE